MEENMETILIITILLLIGVFNITMLGVLVFTLFKYKLCDLSTSPIINKTSTSQPPAPTLSEEQEESIRRQKRAYEDQLTAINEMLNYNVNVAYGIKPEDKY